MKTFVILRRNYWGSPAELEQAAARSKEIGQQMADSVRWIRTYALAEKSGKLGTVCVYQAVSEEAIREHGDCAKLPVDDVIEVADVMVVNTDPS